MIVVGIDPGLSGAIAVYDASNGVLLEVLDVPTFQTLVGGKLRTRLDDSQLLHEAGRLRKEYGASLAIIEQTSARPKESPTSARTFGWVCGVIYASFKGFRYRIEHVQPKDWKKAMRVPSKENGRKLGGAIVARADEIFPEHRHLWRGSRGGPLHDRAEAAMIAKYGAEKWK